MNEYQKKSIVLIYLLFGLYLLGLLKLILFKDSHYFFYLHFTKYYSWQLLTQKFTAMNLTPFKTISYYLRGEDTTGTMPNLLGNLLLFVPFGLFLPYLFKIFKRLKVYLLFVFSVSLFLEIIQLVTAYGTFDVDDLILNVTGALLGFLIYSVWQITFFLFKKENS